MEPGYARHTRSLVLLVLFLLMILPMTPIAAASPITVTTLDDTLADDGLCSLREAIIASNTDAAIGGCPAGSGADIIELAVAPIAPLHISLGIAGSGEDNGLAGDLDVVGTLSVQATVPNAPIVLDAGGLDRVFDVLPGGRLTLVRVTSQRGLVAGSSGEGGGILVRATAALTLTDSAVISNTAAIGGGISVQGRLTMQRGVIASNLGGGARVDAGLAELDEVDISDNGGGAGVVVASAGSLQISGGEVSRNGSGGIVNDGATATLTGVRVSGNSGRGVLNLGSARLSASRCWIDGNTAASGAGLANLGPSAAAVIDETRLSRNIASGAGGGISNSGTLDLRNSTLDGNSARSGGALDHEGAILRMTNVTISGNSATDNGGGLHLRRESTLAYVTLAGNIVDGPGAGSDLFVDEAQISLVGTILAAGPSQQSCAVSAGSIVSAGGNVEKGVSCGLMHVDDRSGSDALLGPLQDNGGFAPTHALGAGSPALDLGKVLGCPKRDQIGAARPQGPGCDSGAVEAVVIRSRYFFPLGAG